MENLISHPASPLIGQPRQRKYCRLSAAEIMTIQIGFHLIGGHDFKRYYEKVVGQFHRKEFPDLVSYNHFVEVASTNTLATFYRAIYEECLNGLSGLFLIHGGA